LAEIKPEYKIHPVNKEDHVYFTPDTLENAKGKGLPHANTALMNRPNNEWRFWRKYDECKNCNK
jgi:hypothetical protein